MSKWISVHDMLPGEDQLSLGESEVVLLYTCEGYIGTGFLGDYSNSESWVANQRIPLEFVTHWMPLPEPPEGV